MATNQTEVAGGVSIADATAALVQMDEVGNSEVETTEEDINGGEGQIIDDGSREAGDDEIEAADEAVDDVEEDQDRYDGDPDEVHLVKVDGQEIEVEYGELINGYQRQADYTQKTQELANQRRAVEGQAQQVNQQALHYAQAYLQVSDQMAALAPSEDEIKQAWGFDPKEAAALKDKRDAVLQQAAETRNLAIALHQQSQERQKRAMAEAGAKLPEYVPEWKDLDTRKREVVAVAEYLVSQGISPQDVEQSANPAAWAIARKAWQFDQLQKSAGAKMDKPSVPKIRKTRAPKPRLKGGRKRAAANKKAFDQNQSKENAIAFLAQFEE